MKNKAQVEPIPLIMGVLGAGIGFVISSRMDSGIAMRVASTLITGVACYFLSYFISNSG